MKLKDIHPNPDNPRIIKNDKLEKLKASIQEFPAMMELRPIIINKEGRILGGNMRYRVLEALGYKDIPDSWVKRAEKLTPEEEERFIIEDNVAFGAWDWDMLANNWDKEKLKSWALDLPLDFNYRDDIHQLKDIFLIVPFSILDTRKAVWQERKRLWKAIIGDKGQSRESRLAKGNSSIMNAINSGVSILDPVLSEVVNYWFCPPGGKTFDPFAGDTVFGYVSAKMGHPFTGIELREEQCQINRAAVKGMKARYICDDGQNVAKHIPANSQDLLFSCPPYYDLEVYSDLPNDASNQPTYEDFIKIIDRALTDALGCLKANRFAVIVVGEIRDKKGFYYRFSEDIKDIAQRSNFRLYNELILIEAIGTGHLRAKNNMKSRKITKCHQSVLVFYNGSPADIKKHFPEIKYAKQDEGTDMEQ